PGHLPGFGPQGYLHPQAGLPGSLAARGRLPPGDKGKGRQRPRLRQAGRRSLATQPDGRTDRARVTPDPPRRTGPLAGELPAPLDPLLPERPDPGRSGRTARLDRGDAQGKGRPRAESLAAAPEAPGISAGIAAPRGGPCTECGSYNSCFPGRP